MTIIVSINKGNHSILIADKNVTSSSGKVFNNMETKIIKTKIGLFTATGNGFFLNRVKGNLDKHQINNENDIIKKILISKNEIISSSLNKGDNKIRIKDAIINTSFIYSIIEDGRIIVKESFVNNVGIVITNELPDFYMTQPNLLDLSIYEKIKNELIIKLNEENYDEGNVIRKVSEAIKSISKKTPSVSSNFDYGYIDIKKNIEIIENNRLT